MNIPYLAFVTLQEIPARTELSIDYDPKAARLYEVQRGKGKQRQLTADVDMLECRCKAYNCRGTVKM